MEGVEGLPWMFGHKKRFMVCGKCWFVILRIKRRRGWGFDEHGLHFLAHGVAHWNSCVGLFSSK